MAVLVFLALLCLALSKPIAGFIPRDNYVDLRFPETDFERPPCWPTWVDTEDRCYKVFRMSYTWHKALAFCNSISGDLTSVRNNDDLSIIQDLMKMQKVPAVWVGGSDAVTEGTWQWSDRTPFSWTFWSSGQPDNLGEQDCMSVVTAGVAQDENCEKKFPFVCVTPLYTV